MKIYLSLILLTTAIAGYAQDAPIHYSSSGNDHLLGTILRDDLLEDPFQSWYQATYDSYDLQSGEVEKVNEFYDNEITIKVFLGTWCGDSKLEVPRFLKLVDHSKIAEKDIELICLDNRSEAYKQGPYREEEGMKIHRVPTFVFLKNGEEIGRIVESPANSLAVDIAQIYAGLAPKPNYEVANYLLGQFEHNSTSEVDSLMSNKLRYWKRRVRNEGELNTLGYVLLAAERTEEALIAFKLNTLLFPDAANTFDSLAEAYLKLGDRELAVSNYLHSLRLNTGNDNARKVLQEIIAGGDGD